MSDAKTKHRRSLFPIRIYISVGNRRPKEAKKEELFYPPGWSFPLTPHEAFQWRLTGFIAWSLVIGACVTATLAAAYVAAVLVVYLAPILLRYLQ